MRIIKDGCRLKNGSLSRFKHRNQCWTSPNGLPRIENKTSILNFTLGKMRGPLRDVFHQRSQTMGLFELKLNLAGQGDVSVPRES